MFFYLSNKINEIISIIIIIIVCCLFFYFAECCSELSSDCCVECCPGVSSINNSFDTNTTNNSRKSDTNINTDTNTTNNILHDKQCNLTSTSKSFISIEI